MKKEESSTDLCYDDFEPCCNWKKQNETSIVKEADILEILLPGFKKEELKCEMKWDGFFYISGEHQVGKNQIKRFNKKIDLSNYDIEKIETKFEAGRIHLKLPWKDPAISFFRIKRDSKIVRILRLGNRAFEKATTTAMALALLFLLAFYVYKYCECTNFRNWFN